VRKGTRDRSKRKQSSQERLKQTAVIKEERWTSGVASSERKIYQLEVLLVPSGIIVISVITVGIAVQINHSCLRSIATLITCRR
jgi:hypothetical protein